MEEFLRRFYEEWEGEGLGWRGFLLVIIRFSVASVEDDGTEDGDGEEEIGGETHALLLTPIPEPSTFVLLGIGLLGFVAFVGRKQ